MSLKNNKIAILLQFKYLCVFLISGIDLLLQFILITSTFSYEYAVANAIILFVFCGIYSIKYSLNISASAKKTNILIYFSAFILPIIISFAFNLIFGACPVVPGFKYYFLIVFPAQVLGIGVGTFAASEFKGIGKYLTLTTVFLVFALESFIEFYFYPQVYFFNQIILYWPGTIYDDLIQVNNFWFLFRIITLFFAFFFFFISKLKLKTHTKFAILVIVYLGFFFLKPHLHLSTNMGRIREESKKILQTEHFNILIGKKLDSNEESFVKGLFEFYYDELEKELKLRPKKKITAIIFQNSQQKEKLFGTKNADIAKIWLSQIYLDYGSYRTNLKHELAHIFSGSIGNTLFKMPAHFNVALLEGFATAAADNFDEAEIDYPAALDYKISGKMPIERIFKGLNFYWLNSSKSYAYAGSFSNYLKGKYGIKKFERFYNGGNFKNVFGKSIDSLSIEYENYLKSLDVVPNKSRWQLYFGRTPVIKKFCFRTVAEEREQAEKLTSLKEFKKAEKIYAKLVQSVGSAKDFMNLLFIKLALRKYRETFSLLEKYLSKFKKSSEYFRLLLVKAKVLRFLGRNKEAEDLLKRIIKLNVHPNLTYLAGARLELLKRGFLADTLSLKKREDLFESLIFNEKDSRFIFSLLYLERAKKKCKLITKFTSQINSLKYLDSYHLIKLARICETNLKFETALKLLEKAKEINNFSFREKVIGEEIEKVKYLEKNCGKKWE